MFTLVKRLSVPHLAKAPLRSGLVVLGIALGVAMLVASRATSDAMLTTFDDLVKRIADRADLVVTGNESGIPIALVAKVAEVAGVAHAAPALEVTTSLVSDGEPLLILGVDFLGDPHFLPFRAEGGGTLVADPLAFINDPAALLISRALAQRHGLGVGSRVAVLGAGGVRTLIVRAVLQDSGPAASFGGQVAVMSLDAAQLAFGRGTLVDRIDVALVPNADQVQVMGRLRTALAGAAQVELPAQLGRRMRALSKPLSDGIELSGVLVLFVAVFIIYNAVGVAVAQRRREVGVLRALGVLRHQVVMLFCIEAAVLALVGVALGLSLAQELVALTHAETELAISRLYGSTPAVPAITLANALCGGLAGVAVALVSAYLPARRGARLDPVAALQQTSALSSSQALPYVALGLAGAALMVLARPVAEQGSILAAYLATVVNLTGAGLLVPLLLVTLRRALLPLLRRTGAVSVRLGLDYVERNLSRSTMNVLALMVAVALSLGTSGWLRSFEHSVRAWFEQVSAADLVVTAGSPLADRHRMPLSPDTLQRLHGLPGVAEVQAMRMIDQGYGAKSFRLVASDTRAYLEQSERRGKPWKVLQGEQPIAPGELADAPRIVLAENAAQRLGLFAGDRMTLQTPSGPTSFEVRAVVVDYSSGLGAGFIDRKFYLRSWQDPAIDVVNLYLAPGARPAAVAQAVRARLGGGGGLFVTETGTLREEFVRLADESFSYTRALELIMLVIAITGVIGTMVAAVLDRTREIGLLRAIGATRLQIAVAVLVEAGFLGLCAACAGVVAGSVHCALLLHTVVARSSGWHLDFVFPTASVLRVSALVIAAAAAAGLAPAVRAARLDVKDALVGE